MQAIAFVLPVFRQRSVSLFLCPSKLKATA